MRRKLRAIPGLNELFDSSDPEAILARLQREEEGTAFMKRFQAFLARCGHRFLGRDIRHATWRERPETVIDMIRMNRGSDLCRKAFELQRQRRVECGEGIEGQGQPWRPRASQEGTVFSGPLVRQEVFRSAGEHALLCGYLSRAVSKALPGDRPKVAVGGNPTGSGRDRLPSSGRDRGSTHEVHGCIAQGRAAEERIRSGPACPNTGGHSRGRGSIRILHPIRRREDRGRGRSRKPRAA